MAALALSQTAWLAAALAVAGACTGVLAGLFGVGGGTVVVPVLYEVFELYGVPDEIRMRLPPPQPCVFASTRMLANVYAESYYPENL